MRRIETFTVNPHLFLTDSFVEKCFFFIVFLLFYRIVIQLNHGLFLRCWWLWSWRIVYEKEDLYYKIRGQILILLFHYEERVIFFIRHFSKWSTLHRNALAVWAACLDLCVLSFNSANDRNNPLWKLALFMILDTQKELSGRGNHNQRYGDHRPDSGNDHDIPWYTIDHLQALSQGILCHN